MEIQIADTPKPPYYAVIFTTRRTDRESELYQEMNDHLMKLVRDHDGFLGVESSGPGLTVTYWRDLESIKEWKQNTFHAEAIEKGKSSFYSELMTRVCLVERDNHLVTGA